MPHHLSDLTPINSKYPFPRFFDCIVEIPLGSSVKYEYNKDKNYFRVDRTLISAMKYPGNYGFIPQTLAEDGDPLDVLIDCREPFIPGSVVCCKYIGHLEMTDNGDYDRKIIAIPEWHNRVDDINSLADLDPMFLSVVEDFFTHYKNNEKKNVIVKGWFTGEPSEGCKVIKKAYNRHKK